MKRQEMVKSISISKNYTDNKMVNFSISPSFSVAVLSDKHTVWECENRATGWSYEEHMLCTGWPTSLELHFLLHKFPIQSLWAFNVFHGSWFHCIAQFLLSASFLHIYHLILLFIQISFLSAIHHVCAFLCNYFLKLLFWSAKLY